MLSALQQVYGDTALKKSAVYNWFSWFKNGLEKSMQDPVFLTKIITGDESWVFAYDLETKM